MSLEEQRKVNMPYLYMGVGSAADVRRIDGKDLRSDGCDVLISLPNNPTQPSQPTKPGLQSVRPAPPLGCWIPIRSSRSMLRTNQRWILRTHLEDNSEQDQSTHPNNPNTQLILPTIRILESREFSRPPINCKARDQQLYKKGAGIFIRTEPTEISSRRTDPNPLLDTCL